MPLYHFKCTGPETHRLRRILKPAEAAALKPVCECGADMVRDPKPPTANVVERLDNGYMAKAVERPADAERLYRERAQADPLKDD
jgi:hypothetical protein